MSATAALWLQVTATLAIPGLVLGGLLDHGSRGRAVTWLDVRLVASASLIPVFVVFAIRGVVSDWLAFAGVLGAISLGLLVHASAD